MSERKRKVLTLVMCLAAGVGTMALCQALVYGALLIMSIGH